MKGRPSEFAGFEVCATGLSHLFVVAWVRRVEFRIAWPAIATSLVLL